MLSHDRTEESHSASRSPPALPAPRVRLVPNRDFDASTSAREEEEERQHARAPRAREGCGRQGPASRRDWRLWRLGGLGGADPRRAERSVGSEGSTRV